MDIKKEVTKPKPFKKHHFAIPKSPSIDNSAAEMMRKSQGCLR